MNRVQTAAAAMWLLAACAASPRYGSFLPEGDRASEVLAVDACRKVQRVAPAEQPVVQASEQADAFWAGLERCLRQAGYEVWPTQQSADGLRIHYLVDRVRGTQLLRTTLWVGDVRLSRAYQRGGASVRSLGPWASVGGE